MAPRGVEAGLSVPRDVSAVRVPYEELGHTAVRLALDREVGLTSDHHVVLGTRLVVRDSVGPAAG
jgi:LacI family transcriptional regulator